MYVSYNYTAIKKREKRLYSFQDIKISSSGISTRILTTFAICMVIVNIFGIGICIAMGDVLYWPFKDGGFEPNFLIAMIAIPFGIAMALCNIKIQNYPLLDFFIQYFRPKKTVDQNNEPVSEHKVRIKSLVENINVIQHEDDEVVLRPGLEDEINMKIKELVHG